MANENEIETKNNKVAVGIRLEPDVNAAVAAIMADDNRPSVANTVESLLKTHPRIQPILDAQPAAATAGNA